MKVAYFTLLSCGIFGAFLGIAGFISELTFLGMQVGVGISIVGLGLFVIGVFGIAICQMIETWKLY